MKKFKTILYYVCALGVLAMIADAVIMSIFGADAVNVRAVTIPFLLSTLSAIILCVIERD
jgi:hypothetical protein